MFMAIFLKESYAVLLKKIFRAISEGVPGGILEEIRGAISKRFSDVTAGSIPESIPGDIYYMSLFYEWRGVRIVGLV